MAIRHSTIFSFLSRTSAAIRTAAMTSLQALLQGRLLAQNQLDQLLPDLLPKVIDSNQFTAHLSFIAANREQGNAYTERILNQTYNYTYRTNSKLDDSLNF